MIDLDYTANTPVDERVLARFCETERLCIGNANSRHAAGRQAAEILHASLRHMAQMLGAKETEIIQTSGASESIRPSRAFCAQADTLGGTLSPRRWNMRR